VLSQKPNTWPPQCIGALVSLELIPIWSHKAFIRAFQSPNLKAKGRQPGGKATQRPDIDETEMAEGGAADGAREQGWRCVRGMCRQASAHQKPIRLLSMIVTRSEGASGLDCEICAELHF
jgi:hypothetical protein